MINMEAAKKRTQVKLEAPVSAVVLSLDPAKMKQVVDNLLSNAVKFSPPGSLIRVYVRSEPAAGTGSFSVRDQGPGIPEGERDRLFKDFGRLSSQPTAGEKSTGLGLAICRKIVERHGGVPSRPRTWPAAAVNFASPPPPDELYRHDPARDDEPISANLFR